MATKGSCTPEEIILKLREVEELHSRGKIIAQAVYFISLTIVPDSSVMMGVLDRK